MNARRYVALATLGTLAVGVNLPAQAAKKAPVTKEYTMRLAPVPEPLPSGTSCKRAQLEGLSIHTETLTTTGPGTLKIMVSGFAGDWDITLLDAQRNEIAKGDGTSTGGGAPATAGVDTLEIKFKKADTYLIATCNFAGSPAAKGSYTYTYK